MVQGTFCFLRESPLPVGHVHPALERWQPSRRLRLKASGGEGWGPVPAPMSGAGACAVPISPCPIVAPTFLEEGSQKLEDAAEPISGAQGCG